MLKGRNIVVGVTGSIAAFKIPALIRLLKKEGADVKVMMTPAARDFVTPLTLSTLSGHPVIIEPFDAGTGEWNSHVDLGRWADLYILAPVSANTLAKMAHGIADNFLLTAYLSAKCPVFFAPAMDLDMYHHPTTRKNIEILQSFGHTLIEPTVGELASGLCGAGRMEEPENILHLVGEFFSKPAGTLSGRHVLVTAGPTYEAIDPVRFIGNHSSGLMGFSLAEECARQGARVTLVTGPVHLAAQHPAIITIPVVSASDMHAACMKILPKADIVIMSAAVADYTPASPSRSKLKKTGDSMELKLKATADILADMGKKKKKNQVLAGFALETDHEEDNARKKMAQKNLDLVILNSLRDKGAGFKTATNKVTIFLKSGQVIRPPLKSKEDIAREIVQAIGSLI